MTDRSRATQHFRITVPATSANLGPGFDCLAIALDLHNQIDIISGEDAPPVQLEIAGEGAAHLARDESNLVYRAMCRVAEEAGRGLPPIRLHLTNGLPLGRGLGSSAAAIVGGIVAAVAVLDLTIDLTDLLAIGLCMESHPDNMAAALFGGITIGVIDAGRPLVHRITPPSQLRAVLLIPDRFSSTRETRAALPSLVPRADAVYNSGRCGLLVAALMEGRFDLLGVAMQDRLHQPQRTVTFPFLEPAIEAALTAGAYGAALSGAGSTVIALTSSSAEQVAAALAHVARTFELPARTAILAPVAVGARCIALS